LKQAHFKERNMIEDDIIWSLECCCCGVPDACSDCNYDNYPSRICVQHLTADALELIKKYKEEIKK